MNGFDLRNNSYICQIEATRSMTTYTKFNAASLEEHPMKSHQPFYDSSSGAKVIISTESAKWFANYSLAFFISRFVALSSFCSNSIRSFNCSWVGCISLIRILLYVWVSV